MSIEWFENKRVPETRLSLADQRAQWFMAFLKPYLVIIIVYITMYLIRNNFKAAQPMMKEQLGLTTVELGYIGFRFSVTTGCAKY